MTLRPLTLLVAAALALPLVGHASHTPGHKPVARKKATPPKPVAPPVVLAPLAAADEEQLAAAKMAHHGVYDCEFNQSIQLIPNPRELGYVDVAWNKEIFTMKPVLSSTGALRLEDVAGRTLMIQIANKSMLMDTKIGRRLVDECIHPVQRAAIEAAKANPAPAESSLGIDPSKAVAAAASAPAAALATTAAAPLATAAAPAPGAASAPAGPAATAATTPPAAPAAVADAASAPASAPR